MQLSEDNLLQQSFLSLFLTLVGKLILTRQYMYEWLANIIRQRQKKSYTKISKTPQFSSSTIFYENQFESMSCP